MSFGRPGGALDTFRVAPPDRGSFPLDHDGTLPPLPIRPVLAAPWISTDVVGECKEFMMGYLKCLKLNQGNNGFCRMESKGYLQCRMDQSVPFLNERDRWLMGSNLMTKDDMSNLGLGDVGGSHTGLRPDPSIALPTPKNTNTTNTTTTTTTPTSTNTKYTPQERI